MSDNEEWVSSKEGAAILDIPQPNFLYYVKTGEVEARKGKKYKEYKRSDIIQLRKNLLAKSKPAKNPPVLIDWMYPLDVPTGLKLSQIVYSEEIDLAEAAIYQGWRKHNNLLTMAAFNPDRSECYASIQLVPLPENVILDVLRGKRAESSILPDEVRPYDESGPYVLLATSATCLKDKPHLLYQLLYRYMQFWIEHQYPARYIHKIYAQAVSEQGEMLAQHFFMSPRYDLASNAYELDLTRPSASKIIRKFKQQLEEKAPLPDALHWHTPTLPVEPIQAIAEPTRKQQPAITHNDALALPPHLIAVKTYAKNKGIPPSTLASAIKRGDVPAIEGTWKQGRATIKKALDAEGRKKVDELFNK